MSTIPNLYFRIRENGAAVFRLDGENRDRRLEFDQIAVINTNRGEYKVQGDHVLSQQEQQAIETWIAERMTLLKQRDVDDVTRIVDQLNLATHWAQTKAQDDQLESVTEDLLLAMHDLRTVLLRKKADRLEKP